MSEEENAQKLDESETPGDVQPAQDATPSDEQQKDNDEPKWEEQSQPQANVIDFEKKAAELEDKYLRCHAEFDNYRKRMAREFNDVREQARRSTVTDFLTVYDYFAMGMASIDTAPNIDILKQGMTMIWAEFQKTLDTLGVKPLDSVGKPFDAKLHDAVSQEPSETVPEGIVLREWKKAFMIGDKLLRPAVVVVSSGPEKTPVETLQDEQKTQEETLQDEQKTQEEQNAPEQNAPEKQADGEPAEK